PSLRHGAADNRSAHGGYVLAEASHPRRVTLISTGSEVQIAMAAREMLEAAEVGAAVVSLPCWELFAAETSEWRNGVLGSGLRVGIESASGFGWERWLGPEGIFVGMRGFGASAPADVLFRHFGITAERVVALVRERLG
ncbi:MAG: transketolase-like TK C-terminal-containing protein, partial [Acetobacteraceae bacterium]